MTDRNEYTGELSPEDIRAIVRTAEAMRSEATWNGLTAAWRWLAALPARVCFGDTRQPA
jgi:hypothetical protein